MLREKTAFLLGTLLNLLSFMLIVLNSHSVVSCYGPVFICGVEQ